jgi:hypothetical protein
MGLRDGQVIQLIPVKYGVYDGHGTSYGDMYGKGPK